MGTQRLVVVLALLFFPALALAQDSKTEPLESAFTDFAKTWAATRAPDPSVFGRGGSIGALFSARSFAGPRRVSLEADQQPGLPGARRGDGGRRGDGVNWAPGRPLDGFSNGFDAFGNPSVGPVDIRGQARNYVRQRIVSEILSKTALGRGLSVFVETNKSGLDPARSRLLPFISPKVNAREGKAALTFTWKF